MPCPASAGAAETANGAVERMVLLGLTSRIISNFVARFLLAATTFAIRLRKDYGGQEATVVKKDAKIAKCRGGRQKQLKTKFSWPLACNDAIYNTLVMQNSIMQNC